MRHRGVEPVATADAAAWMAPWLTRVARRPFQTPPVRPQSEHRSCARERERGDAAATAAVSTACASATREMVPLFVSEADADPIPPSKTTGAHRRWMYACRDHRAVRIGSLLDPARESRCVGNLSAACLARPLASILPLLSIVTVASCHPKLDDYRRRGNENLREVVRLGARQTVDADGSAIVERNGSRAQRHAGDVEKELAEDWLTIFASAV